MQLVWYCLFWSIVNQFCVIQFILISFLSQCSPNVLDWSMLVHGMVPACCSKSDGSYSCVVHVSSEPRFNVQVLSMQLWCILWTWVDSVFHCVPLYDVGLLIILQYKLYIHKEILAYFVPTSIYKYDLKLNTSQRLIIGGFLS